MKKPACPRLWEVEAARDQRLSGGALAAQERHLADCAECTREQHLFNELSSALRAHEPADEVSLRRLRSSLLRSAHAGNITHDAPRYARQLPLIAAVCAVALVGIFVAVRARVPVRPQETVVVLTPIGDARFSREDTLDRHRVDLRDGTLDLAVQRPAGGKGLVVRVPDGAIEDVGTRFQVVVSDSRTQSVTVSEGAVMFRRADGLEVRLSAGQRWTRESPPATPEAPEPSRQPELDRGKPAAAPRVASATPSTTSTQHDGVLSSGPLEDTAYLHVVALLREGRSAEARVAARDYLRKFPDGFRRVEMERVAR